jgi:Flp pilus assembly protein TadD
MKRGGTVDQQEPGSSAYIFHPVFAVVLLSLLGSAIYANSLGNGFVFDDLGLVVQNPQIREIRQLPGILGLVGRAAYRPLRTASYAIDYHFFGLNPAGYHAINILIHIVNGSLVFFTLRALLNRPRPALLAAILFIVHPVQTDSVTYISGRRDLIFTLFYLIGFYAFVRYRGTRRARYLLFAGASYLLSLLSKEMAITLPLLCFCYDVVRSLPAPNRPNSVSHLQSLWEGIRTVIRRYKGLYLPTTAALVLLAGYFIFFVNPSLQRRMWGGGVWPMLLTSARIFAHYLRLLVLPLTLNADYSYNAFPISHSITEPPVMLALTVLVAAWWGIYRLLTEDRWQAFGGLWFFITLLPVSQIIPHHELLAEHYLYLPSAGIFLAVALLLEKLMERTHHTAAISAAFAFLVLLLAIRTVIRNRDWKDSLSLWTKTVQTAPESARAHTNLGHVYLAQGRFVLAEQEFREALRIQPDDAVNRDDHGLALLRLGRLDEAEREFREAIRLDQHNADARGNLGKLYLEQGRFREGAMQLEEAVRLKRSNASFHRLLGEAYYQQGMKELAAVELTSALKLKADFPEARRLLDQMIREK